MASRRLLLKACALALAPSALARAAVRPAARLEVPIDIVGDVTVVSTMIAGKGPFRLSVSPAVQVNQIAADLVVKLNLLGALRGHVDGPGGRTAADLYTTGGIVIGGVVHQTGVPFVSVTRLSPEIDGALSPAFAGFSAGFDFRHRKLYLQQGSAPSEGASEIPFVVRPEHHRRVGTMQSFTRRDLSFESPVKVAARIGDLTGTFAIDTASPGGVTLMPGFVSDHGLWDKFPNAAETRYADVSGDVKARQARLGPLVLGDRVIPAPMVTLLDPAGTRDSPHVDGLIGMQVLQAFDLWIDWDLGSVFLTQAAQ